MQLRFMLSGALVHECEAEVVPPVGSKVIFRMYQSKKGIDKGALVSAIVQGGVCAPAYDYSEPGNVMVYIDLDEFEELPTVDRSG